VPPGATPCVGTALPPTEPGDDEPWRWLRKLF
jgi:hypothetical protein